ncbi:MAG: protein kinase [Chlamydia sp.]
MSTLSLSSSNCKIGVSILDTPLSKKKNELIMLRLPNGESVSIKKESSFLLKIAHFFGLKKESGTHILINEDNQCYTDKKEIGKKIAPLIINQKGLEAYLGKQNQTAEKIDSIYKNFELNLFNLLLELKTSGQDQTVEYNNNNFQFTLRRDKKNRIEVLVEGGELGKGGFKTASTAYSATQNKERVGLRVHDKGEFQYNSIKKEHAIVQDLRSKGVPFILKTELAENRQTKEVSLIAELCDVGDLNTLIQSNYDGFDFNRFNIAIKTAEGLSKMHENGYVHCDIKPDNIFINREDNKMEPRIGDFGLASKIGASTEVVGGTRSYMAPECFNGGVFEYKASMDVFSFGNLLYDLFSGGKPCLFESSDGTFKQVNLYHHQQVQNRLKAAGQPLYDLIAQCVSRNPEDRPDMESVKKSLQQIHEKGNYI